MVNEMLKKVLQPPFWGMVFCVFYLIGIKYLQSIYEVKKVLKKLETEKSTDYAEFMIHSSELMPGGSPYFKTNEEINSLYNALEAIFKYASKNFSGLTLKEYRNKL